MHCPCRCTTQVSLLSSLRINIILKTNLFPSLRKPHSVCGFLLYPFFRNTKSHITEWYGFFLCRYYPLMRFLYFRGVIPVLSVNCRWKYLKSRYPHFSEISFMPSVVVRR